MWAWAMALRASSARDGGDLRDDFAGDGGADGEVAVGGGDAEVGEDCFDFLF